MIEQFREWFLKSQNSTGEVMLSFVNSGKGSAYLDVETDFKFARITLWDNGDCDMEILDGDSGKQEFWENYVFSDWIIAQLAIEAFIERLKAELYS
jgi:hypothetical protein